MLVCLSSQMLLEPVFLAEKGNFSRFVKQSFLANIEQDNLSIEVVGLILFVEVNEVCENKTAFSLKVTYTL